MDRIDRDIFQWKGQNFGWQRIYGGQVMAQCLIAANLTAEGGGKKKTHSYFLRPGIMEESILFDVDRIEWKKFYTRRVRAIQMVRIFACSISFKKEEKDLSIKLIDLNEIPKPEDLPSDWELRNKAIGQLGKKDKFFREQKWKCLFSKL